MIDTPPLRLWPPPAQLHCDREKLVGIILVEIGRDGGGGREGGRRRGREGGRRRGREGGRRRGREGGRRREGGERGREEVGTDTHPTAAGGNW